MVMLKSLTSLPGLSFPLFPTRRTCLSKMSARPSPVCPKFVSAEGSDVYSRCQPDGIRFRLVSYNILAQVYVKSSLFPHSPSPCLKWKARSQAMLTVLKNLGADFLCLQELDEYDSFYKQNIESYGYSSIYIQRSGRKRDGCGIFYKRNCAELLLDERIDYNDLVSTNPNESKLSDAKTIEKKNSLDLKDDSSLKGTLEKHGDPNDPHIRLKRDCVGIMGAFRLKDALHQVVIVANTHLYWDPEWADVKLAQAKFLLSRLSQFVTLVSVKFGCTPSVIVAGDFNSTPGDKVYQYLTSGHSSSIVQEECLDQAPMPLCSAYAHSRGEPAFTSCKPDFTSTLDYIFFSLDDKIKPVSFLELPDANSLDIIGGLPNYYHPSEHLPIGAEFDVSLDSVILQHK